MNNKIIKNTIILYIKLIVTTVVGLYSSRFILKALGIDDYGLYVVIGGVVTIMNFLSTVMTTTSYRFITVELGKGDKGEPQLIYNKVDTYFFGYLFVTFGRNYWGALCKSLFECGSR
jgi:O-antigen/teichoic acid export membrane protein